MSLVLNGSFYSALKIKMNHDNLWDDGCAWMSMVMQFGKKMHSLSSQLPELWRMKQPEDCSAVMRAFETRFAFIAVTFVDVMVTCPL